MDWAEFRDWKLIAVLGVVAAWSAFMPLAAAYECRADDCPGAVGERARLAMQRNRDPDKTRLHYWRAYDAGSRRSIWASYYGDNLRLLGVDAAGIETYELEKWTAVDGPDYVSCRITIRFRGDIAFDYRAVPAGRTPSC